MSVEHKYSQVVTSNSFTPVFFVFFLQFADDPARNVCHNEDVLNIKSLPLIWKCGQVWNVNKRQQLELWKTKPDTHFVADNCTLKPRKLINPL